MKPDLAFRNTAVELRWPRDLTPLSPDFLLQMVLLQMDLLRHYLQVGMPAADRPRAHRTLDSLNLRRRFLERRRVWR